MFESIKLGFAKIFFYSFGFFPLTFLHALGKGLGSLLYKMPIRINYYVRRNIELCFPDLSPKELDALVKLSTQEAIKGFMEFPVFWVRSVRYLNSLITQVDGFEQLEADFANQKGIIILGNHMGAYYLANAFLAPRLPNSAWIYKPQQGMIEALTKHMRNQFGAKFVPTSLEGVRDLYRNLRRGYVAGMSCDHNALDSGGVFAPYFNIPVSTMTLAGRLASKAKSPVYFVYMERLAKGQGYHLHVQKLGAEIYSTDSLVSATAMNKVLEDTVRQYPSQAEWIYRRFWDRPAGESPLYKTQE